MIELLLDADSYVYSIGWTTEITDIPLEKYYEYRVSNVVCNVMGMIPDECTCELFLTDGKDNFRNKVAVSYAYKGNRSKDGKPVHYDIIRDVMVDAFGATMSYTEEADDTITIRKLANPEFAISASIDKDFLGTPGKHLHLKKKGEFELLDISEDEASKFFWAQVLTGDGVDNIKAIKGIGPVKANKILQEAETDYERFLICVEKYEEHGLTLDRLIENGTLLYLRRESNEIWTPPTAPTGEIQ